MKRSSGLIALLAVLLMDAHLTSPRRLSPVPVATTQSETARTLPGPQITVCEAFGDVASSRKGSSEEDLPGSGKSNGEITAQVKRYLYGASEQIPPGSRLPVGITLMIATVPDPAHTHLSLQFDRSLEAIQQAAQDEHYIYDSSWLPWQSANTQYSSLADQIAAEAAAASRENCPGVILFRRNATGALPDNCVPSVGASSFSPVYECGLMMFIVGERPTSGININQWANALQWIREHASPGRRDKALRILGPSFSGSMPSIVRALKELKASDTTFTSSLVYAGHIRGCAPWRGLETALSSTGSNPPPVPVRISDFSENDAVQIDRFFRYLEDREHHLSEVAILSEDETAYGGLPDVGKSESGKAETGDHQTLPSCSLNYPANDRPVHLYYPRDISAIRSAYQEQSIFSQDNPSETHVVLRPESNASAHKETDTIEPFSGPNTALTQEAQLYGIVNTLKTHGIRYIVLRSTNSLDNLFLTRFLHRAYPSAYIVTMGSDLLFGREIDSTEFRGVVALSSFPLLPRAQDWTRQTDSVPQHAHRVFGSYTMEGDYLAARYLITDHPEVDPNKPAHSSEKPDIPDFAPPFWDKESPGNSSGKNSTENSSQPATWLAVVGRDGYWPLAVLTLPSRYSASSPYSNLTHVPKSADKPGSDPVPNRFTLPSVWKFFCALSVLLLVVHFFACCCGWKQQDLGVFIQFTPMQGVRGSALMALGWMALCSLFVLQFMAAGCLWKWLTPIDRFWVILSGVGALSGCALAFITMRARTLPRANGGLARETKVEQRRSTLSRLTVSPYLWITCILVFVVLFIMANVRMFSYGSHHADGVPVAYRAVYLTSGVSPLVSLLFMLAGLYWWFWQNLAGLALLGNGRPVLPARTSIPLGLARVSDQMAADIESAAMPFPTINARNRSLYLFPLALVLGQAIVLQRPWSQPLDLVLHSLESAVFNWTLHFFFGIALFLLFLECGQLLFTWLSLKRLLMALNRLPLRRTFAALQGLSMRSLWSLSGTSSRARYQIFSHQMESLLHLRNELHCGPTLREALDEAWEQALVFVKKRSQGLDLAMVNDDEALAIREEFSRCTEVVFNKILLPQWTAERASNDPNKVVVDADGDQRPPLSNIPVVRVAEEFVCLIYVGYLQNLLARMRTMVLSIAGIFAAIALSVAFYPYTPRPTITLALTMLFLVIGALVAAIYAGLDKDATLSHITNTKPGTLGLGFWARILSFAAVPALSLLVAQFPGITDFVTSWIRPGIDAMK
jgi:hypothetical protein